jgi:hypothetical protein
MELESLIYETLNQLANLTRDEELLIVEAIRKGYQLGQG